MQFDGRAAVGGRIGRQRRRDSAEGVEGRAVGNGAARPVRAGRDSGWQAGLAGADQCGVAHGGRACPLKTTFQENSLDPASRIGADKVPFTR